MLSAVAPAAQPVALTPHETTCRLCGAGSLRPVIDFGRLPLPDRPVPVDAEEPLYSLRIVVCEACMLVQTQCPIVQQHPPRAVAHPAPCTETLTRFTTSIQQKLGLNAHSLVISMAPYDNGVGAAFRSAGIPVLDLDPMSHGEPTSFNAETALDIAVRHGKADLVVASDLLADVADLFDFAAGFTGILKPKGIAVFEFQHLQPVLQKCRFDAFRHDRYNYLTLGTLERVLHSVGLRIFDVESLPDHGGSLRAFACLPRGPYAARPALKTAREAEARAGLDRPEGYDGLEARLRAAEADVRAFLRIRCAAGRRVAAYGISTHGTALLNACGITTAEIAWIADPSADAFGDHPAQVLPGSRIPVVAPAMLYRQRPDDLIILSTASAADAATDLAPLRQVGTLFWTVAPGIRRA